MEENRKEKLQEAGINVETALDRFMGNEALFLRFLFKFAKDENFGKYTSAMEQKDYKGAFEALHTLKGLCGNLSLDNLFQVVNKEVEYLRGEQYQEADALMPEVAAEYGKIIETLNSMEES